VISGVGGVTDHGALTGLADDDHTQYVLADGSRAITNGIVINESNADSDTRVEGTTDQYLIYADAGANRVGIGTNTPAVKLDIVGSTRLGNNNGLYWTDSGATSRLIFKLDSSNIFSWNESNLNNDFRFGSTSTDNFLCLDVDADKIGISTNAPDEKLHIYNGDLLLENNYTINWRTIGVGGPTNTPLIGLNGSDILSINYNGGDIDTRILGNSIDNLLYIDAGNDRVGINTSSPGAKLHVAGGNILLDNTQYLRWKDSGGTAQSLIQLNSSDTLVFTTPTTFNMSASRTGVLGLFNNTDTNGDGWQVRLGDGTNNLTTSNQFFLFIDNVGGTVVGQIRSDGSGGTVYVDTSDLRLKSNITPMVDALPRVMKLKPSEFDMGGGHKEGLIAQWTKEVYPQAVVEPKDENDYYGIDKSQLVPLLVGAIQELTTKVEELEKKLEEKNDNNI